MKSGPKIQEVIGSEVRVTVPGHMQRGGEPCSYDRVLATRLGAAAARLIAQEQYGYMVAVKTTTSPRCLSPRLQEDLRRWTRSVP